MDKKTLNDFERILDSKLDQKLKPINSKLDALTLDMIDVQKKTDILPDLHSMIKDTKEKVDEHEQRIEALEHAA